MRQILSTAVVAVIVSLLTLTVAGAVAQAPAEERAVTPAITQNSNRVDGKHAVAYTNKRGVRAGKLVATNGQGLLPSNIVQPYWGYIKNKPGILADHQIAWGEVTNTPAILADQQISWGEVVGKPGVLADDQVGWGEVAGKPPGFADNVDNAGVTAITVTRVSSGWVSVGPNTANGVTVPCPSGRAVAGGFDADSTWVQAARSYPSSSMTEWNVTMRNDGSAASDFKAYAICLTVEPVARLNTASLKKRR
jgi:hypothetical protein